MVRTSPLTEHAVDEPTEYVVVPPVFAGDVAEVNVTVPKYGTVAAVFVIARVLLAREITAEPVTEVPAKFVPSGTVLVIWQVPAVMIVMTPLPLTEQIEAVSEEYVIGEPSPVCVFDAGEIVPLAEYVTPVYVSAAVLLPLLIVTYT
jgi:hypothetical protein